MNHTFGKASMRKLYKRNNTIFFAGLAAKKLGMTNCDFLALANAQLWGIKTLNRSKTVRLIVK